MKIRWWHHYDCLRISIVTAYAHAGMEERTNFVDFNMVRVTIRIMIRFRLGSS